MVGGGIAGLWTLARLRQAGVEAVLLEAQSLGHGQTVQAQGIVHGGGKYALRGVGDRAAIEAIRAMPDRWRTHLAGEAYPSLRAATRLSDHCWLWLPRGSFRARLESLGLMPMLRHGGLLHCPPLPVEPQNWPESLRASALRVYRMAEPVLDTRSVQSALREQLEPWLLAFRWEDGGRSVDVALDDQGRIQELGVPSPNGSRSLRLRPRSIVLTAGAQNADWLRRLGHAPSLMQERPLRMFLLRGRLPALHGHCFLGGKTRLTVTSLDLEDGRRVWQLGGEIAERNADREPDRAMMAEAVGEIGRLLPGLDLDEAQISSYRAVRAEGRTVDRRRPGGVQLERVAPGLHVAWPTKWALAPILAEEILGELGADPQTPLTSTPDADAPPALAEGWPRPAVAPGPWEEDLPWNDVRSVAPA